MERGGKQRPAARGEGRDRTLWDEALVIGAICEWADEHDGVPPSLLDWTPSLARHAGRADLADAWERSGRWPRSQTVALQFGSWNAGIQAAGFRAMAQGYSRSRGDAGVFWTDERLLSAVGEWVELTGSVPAPSDWNSTYQRLRGSQQGRERLEQGSWPSVPVVLARFGSFSECVRAAGHEPRTPALIAAGFESARWSRDAVVEGLRRFAAASGGRAPTAAEAAARSTRAMERLASADPDAARSEVVLPTFPVVSRYFASWNDALRAAGLEPRIPGVTARWGTRDDPHWSKERIVERIQTWAACYGDAPTCREWGSPKDDAWPSVSTVVHRFGSFNAALEAAGYGPRVSRFEVSWNAEMVLDAMREWHQLRGEPPRESDWSGPFPDDVGPSQHGSESQPWPSPATVRRLHGTWTAALRAAGTPRERVAWTHEHVVDAIREWVELHGRVPRQADWRSLAGKDLEQIGVCSHGSVEQPWPSSPTVHRLFGSWRTAISEAGVS